MAHSGPFIQPHRMCSSSLCFHACMLALSRVPCALSCMFDDEQACASQLACLNEPYVHSPWMSAKNPPPKPNRSFRVKIQYMPFRRIQLRLRFLQLADTNSAALSTSAHKQALTQTHTLSLTIRSSSSECAASVSSWILISIQFAPVIR